jgi:NADH-quinone oxidoreductase subunit J
VIAALAFYAFAAVLVAASTMVVAARNPVHAVLFLILAFFNAAGLFLLAGAEFLALILVIVYVGAVAVLFLFVVMMLDINVDAMRAGFWKHLPLALLLGALVSVELIAVLWAGFPTATVDAAVATTAMHAPDHNNTHALGVLLYRDYLYPIQVAAVILLVAMVAAIALTLRGRKDTKTIDPGVQVRVKASDRLQVLRVPPATVAAADAAKEEQA